MSIYIYIHIFKYSLSYYQSKLSSFTGFSKVSSAEFGMADNKATST